MRRSADAVSFKAGSRIFLFNLPATWQSPAARRLYHAELARLGKHLETVGGRAPTAEELATVIHEHEVRRAALRHLIQQSSARQGAEALAGWFDGGSSLPAPSDTTTQGVRLALVGGPLLPSHWLLFDAIAAASGCVVLNATEPGERCLLPPLPTLTPGRDPLSALADHYFDHAVDVFHRPNSRLYDWLRPRLAERQAQGLVVWHNVGCDLWRAEAQPLREAFGLPVLLLEADGAALPRNIGRLEAFLESLR
jgi:benzoyl-CoA reductase/2-hydroxyglutaryl-CoA dehydratase subunit BcrC/BadD/HgdB